METSREDWIRQRRTEALNTARQILAGDLGVIEGSRRLAALRHDVESNDLDELFIPFVAIDSGTDHLPFGEVTKFWAGDALAEKRAEVAEAERFYRQDALAACTALIHGIEEAG